MLLLLLLLVVVVVMMELPSFLWLVVSLVELGLKLKLVERLAYLSFDYYWKKMEEMVVEQ